MKCPICGKEMEKGFTALFMRGGSSGDLYWAHEEYFKKQRFLPTRGSIEKDGGVVFKSGTSIFDDEPNYSWYCRECGKVTIDVKGKRS